MEIEAPPAQKRKPSPAEPKETKRTAKKDKLLALQPPETVKQDEPKPKATAKAKEQAPDPHKHGARHEPAKAPDPHRHDERREPTEKATQKGIELDKSTKKSYWSTQNIQYIKTQLELRGKRFDPSEFTGNKTTFDNILGKKVKQQVAKITKQELLHRLYKMINI